MNGLEILSRKLNMMNNSTGKSANKVSHEKLAEIKLKMGRQVLTDDDILILACDELSRAYTYEEKQYQ